MTENTQCHPEHSDEIDLIELITNLWKEKLIIFSATAITATLGLIYALTSPPTYKATVQLTPPQQTELDYLNQTKHFEISSAQLFSRFLASMDSDEQLNGILQKNSELVEKSLKLNTENTNVSSLSKKRSIEFPNTKNKINSNELDKYYLSYEGFDRTGLKQLITADIKLNTTRLLEQTHKRYKSILGLKAQSMQKNKELALKNLEDQLTSRSEYVIGTRKDRLIKLEEALKIAKALNLTNPTSLSKLAASTKSNQVAINAELNNNRDPLYLRGTKLLTAEIENIKNLKDTVLLDNSIRELEAKKVLVENNRELEQLIKELEEFTELDNISFYSEIINIPESPIKPKKTLILVISILLGGMIGLFVVIGRIIYRNHKQDKLT